MTTQVSVAGVLKSHMVPAEGTPPASSASEVLPSLQRLPAPPFPPLVAPTLILDAFWRLCFRRVIDTFTFCDEAEAGPIVAGLWGRKCWGEANMVAWNLLEEAGGEREAQCFPPSSCHHWGGCEERSWKTQVWKKCCKQTLFLVNSQSVMFFLPLRAGVTHSQSAYLKKNA